MADSDYHIVVTAARSMFGKRTGGMLARLESDRASDLARGAGPGIGAAKQALINQLGRMAEYTDRAYLFCGDGTVLVCYFSGDSWGYDIIGTDRRGRSACILPGASFASCKAAAGEHAAQSYGGVIHAV